MIRANLLTHAIRLALRGVRTADGVGDSAAILRWVMLGCIVALLCACVPRTIVRTETVEVPRYVRAPVPAELTTPRTADTPAAACRDAAQAVLCNGQLAGWAFDLRHALEQCNADKASIAALGAKEGP